MRISQVKKFYFLKPNAEEVELTVPTNINQSLVRLINPSEYSLKIMTTNRPISEAEYAAIQIKGGETVGHLIPCQAILSEHNPNITEAVYCAYTIIAAHLICEKSRQADYSLAHPDHAGATGPSTVFPENGYYLISWDRKIPNAASFVQDYSLFFAGKGLLFSPKQAPLTLFPIQYDGTQTKLKLRATEDLPSYVATILTELFPFTENPFLRFFYIYQVIEHLMALDLNKQVDKLRAALGSGAVLSATELKEVFNTFQDATREKSRIKKALQPECQDSNSAAENLLGSVSIDYGKMNFAEKIYRIRNNLFHDYQTLHGCSSHMATLCDCLYVYLLGKRISFKA